MKQPSNCPREAMAQIAKTSHPCIYFVVQMSFTWLTGKPFVGQQQKFRSTKALELFKLIIAMGVSVFVSCWICKNLTIWNWLFLPASWLVTVGTQRRFLTGICHRCTHGHYFGNKGDRALAEIVTTCLFLQHFAGYMKEHIKLHHNKKYAFTFLNDPDAKLLFILGFRPGLPEIK
jgi:hypothetical protein